LPERKLVISIAAGFPIRKMEEILYPPLDAESVRNLPIIRVMPNTPALVLSAVSGMSPNRFVTEEDARAARTLLQAVGDVIEFEEEALDAVTALSGSGPAYVFYLVESMTEAGIQMGLEPGAAALLAAATLRGSAKLLEASGESPEELRRRVTSPGGTTAAAIDVFEKRGLKPIIIAAIASANRRAQELSG
jgi:pyrroline-5-carboxylate reductase